MQYVFLDTNIFIHFIDFEQIDWKKFAETNDSICIVLAPIVIDELDKHKYHKSAKISSRVKKLLPKIENIVDGRYSSKYNVRILLNRPKEEIFIENSLEKSEQDDSLLASIIEFSRSIGSEDEVLYVTNDVGPRLKAKSLNIETARPLDEFLLKNEPDELEIKNNQLQREISEFKNKRPIVALSFKDRESIQLYNLKEHMQIKDAYIEEELEIARAKTPLLKYSPPPSRDAYKDPFAFINHNPFSVLSETQVLSYNKQVEEYYIKYKLYAEKAFKVVEFQHNSIKIELILANIGTSPADDIDIDIHFPDGFELFAKDQIPKLGDEPEPPYKPKGALDFGHIAILPPPIIGRSVNHNFITKDSISPVIKKTNSYNVSYHFSTLKHHREINLEPLYVKYNDISLARGFTIDYNISISNLTNVIPGKLYVKFKEVETIKTDDRE